MGLRDAWPLVKETFAEWNEDEVPRLAAALSYYTVFALAPVLLIATAVAGMLFDSTRVRTEVMEQMQGLLGPSGAEMVGTMLEAAFRSRGSVPALVVGIATTLFAASGLFGELQAALNRVWEVKPRQGRGILGLLRDRFVSFTMVLGIGFLLLVSLVLSAGLAAFGKYAGGALPGWTEVLQALNVLLGFGFTAVLFGMMFKVLPDVDLRWRDVALGAVITAGLFTLGRVLIGLYLGRSSVGSAYGAAGSLAIMLLWVYYSSQIMLLGAEFTQVHARWRGTWVQPMAHAEVKPGAHKGTVHPRAQGDESRPRREDAGGTSSPANG